MIGPPRKHTRRRTRNQQHSAELQEILHSLRLVLEMQPDHLDGAIDLLDEAIAIDRQGSATLDPWRNR